MERNDREPFCVWVKKIMVWGKVRQKSSIQHEKFVRILYNTCISNFSYLCISTRAECSFIPSQTQDQEEEGWEVVRRSKKR